MCKNWQFTLYFIDSLHYIYIFKKEEDPNILTALLIIKSNTIFCVFCAIKIKLKLKN